MQSRSSEPRIPRFLGAPADEARLESTASSLRRFRTLLAPYRGALAGIFALAVLSAGLLLVLPLATRYAIDHILTENGDKGALLWIGLGMIAAIVVQQGVEIVRRWWVAIVNMRLVHRLRHRLFGHLLRLPMEDVRALPAGGISARLAGDCEQMSAFLDMGIVTPGVAALRVISTVGVLAFLSWQLAIAAVVVLPLAALINLRFLARIRPLYRGVQADRAAIDGRVVETFAGIETVRAFGREHAELRRYAAAQHAVSRSLLRARAFELLSISGWGFLIPVATTVIVCYGGYLYLEGAVSLGAIMAFQLFVLLLLQPVAQIVAAFGRVQPALAAADRVFAILRMETEADRGTAPLPERFERVRFDGVSFAYRGGPPVLTDVTLDVTRGSTVALVGPSGAGKSTITNVLARFFEPSEGRILVNDVDARTLPLRGYRRRLACVHQRVFLFAGTIRENIAYGRRGASDAAIERAARLAHAHDFITALPEGYETPVGERGVRLSGGEAQRVAIARALLADPEILILDEATSSLDAESEARVQAALQALIAERTTFIIAHRLSTVVAADTIMFVEGGRIVASGTHASLLATEPRYRRMVETQFRGASLDPA